MNSILVSFDLARIEDADAVWGLLQNFSTSYVPSRSAFDRDFPCLIGSDGSTLLVARATDIVVGYLLAHFPVMLFAGGPIFEIAELYVNEGHRGRGIGRGLVETALDRAWTVGCVEAVVPTRRAEGFYEGLGFVRSATYLKLRVEDAQPGP